MLNKQLKARENLVGLRNSVFWAVIERLLHNHEDMNAIVTNPSLRISRATNRRTQKLKNLKTSASMEKHQPFKIEKAIKKYK